MKTHIVIPIGVGAPGSPVLSYLEQSINSILNQTSKEFVITIAADSNIPVNCKDFLFELKKTNKINVKWFEPYSYFKTGGIWKKIFDCWNDVDSKYVAFLHYDDIWAPDKLELQVDFMEARFLAGSFSEVFIIDTNNEITTGDISHKTSLNRHTLTNRTMAFAHSCIMNKYVLFNSGILNYEEQFGETYYDRYKIGFEDIWNVFVHRIKHVKKTPGSILHWRAHDKSVTNTFTMELVAEQKILANYVYEDYTDKNWDVTYSNLMKDTQNMYIDNQLAGWDVPSSVKEDYNSFCKLASTNDSEFSTFKSNPKYYPILEHSSYVEGLEYIDNISETIISKIDEIKINDVLGSPIKYEYYRFGSISPTTLRYMKTATDLLANFSLENKNIVEIGGGYGGQCFILSKLCKFNSYTILDLDGAAQLQTKYLKELGVENVNCTTLDDYDNIVDIDIIISNYAFSELNTVTQNDYFDKIISKSKSGYFQVNPFGNYGKDSLSKSQFIEKFAIFNGTVCEDYPMCKEYPDYFIYMFGKNV